jgi:hypothetical protein
VVLMLLSLSQLLEQLLVTLQRVVYLQLLLLLPRDWGKRIVDEHCMTKWWLCLLLVVVLLLLVVLVLVLLVQMLLSMCGRCPRREQSAHVGASPPLSRSPGRGGGGTPPNKGPVALC